MADPLRPWRRPPPPPPDPSVVPPDLVARAKGLRRRLGDPAGGGSEARRRIRNEYDHALVMMADLLELPGAPEPDLVIGRRVLTTLERSLLEKAVQARGVDLGLPEGAHIRALGPGRPSTPPPPRPPPPRPPSSRPPFPPPASPPLSRRETLIAEARGMRRRLDVYERDERLWPTKVQEWCEDLDTYDGVLIDLAIVMGIPEAALPEGDRRRLLSEERSSIENGLARAGLDMGASRPR